MSIAPRAAALALGLSALVAGCASGPGATATGAASASATADAVSSAGASAEQAERIQEQMTVLREQYGTAAGSSEPLVDVEGRTITTVEPYPGLLAGVRDAEGFAGYASSGAGVDLLPAGTAMVGSQTKTFTAAAILQLDQEGVLSIEDTLADPRWAEVLRWPDAEEITLEMVLSHTAGIPEFAATRGFQEKVADPSWQPRPARLLDFVRDAPALFPPGSDWMYSNTDYIILGLIIEQVTGNSYADEIARRFIDPLGLSDTYLHGYESSDPTTTGYDLWCKGAPRPDSSSTSDDDGPPAACPTTVGEWLPIGATDHSSWPIIWAAGSMVSSTADLTTWITALVSTDEVLDAAHRELMQTPVPQSPAGIAKQIPQFGAFLTGYGLGMFQFSYDIGVGYGHPGNIEGFASSSVYLPGDGNDFAMTVIADQTRADVMADGGNAMAGVLRDNRG
jgi:D-alanyl-D-alanine carboxypeptidase